MFARRRRRRGRGRAASLRLSVALCRSVFDVFVCVFFCRIASKQIHHGGEKHLSRRRFRARIRRRQEQEHRDCCSCSSKFHFYQKFHRVRFARVRDFRARFAHDGVSPGKRKVQLQRRDGTVTRGRVEVIDKFCFVEKGDAFDGIVVVVVIVGECEY